MNVIGKSLRQIQEEEALRLEKERKEQQKQKAATAASTPAPSWGGNKSTPITGWASEGAWGNAVRKGTWDQPNSKPSKASNR